MVNNILDLGLKFLVYIFGILHFLLYSQAIMFNKRHYLCWYRTCFLKVFILFLCIMIKDRVYEMFVTCLQPIKDTHLDLHV